MGEADQAGQDHHEVERVSHRRRVNSRLRDANGEVAIEGIPATVRFVIELKQLLISHEACKFQLCDLLRIFKNLVDALCGDPESFGRQIMNSK